MRNRAVEILVEERAVRAVRDFANPEVPASDWNRRYGDLVVGVAVLPGEDLSDALRRVYLNGLQ